MSKGADVEGIRKALIGDLYRLSTKITASDEASINALTAYIDMLREVHAIAALSAASPPLMVMRQLDPMADAQDIAVLKKAARQYIEEEDAAFSMELRSMTASFCEEFAIPNPMDREEST